MITLKIKCKCGKILRVPEALAGKKVACPACKSAYRIPLEKFGLTPQAAAPVAAAAKKPAAPPGAARPIARPPVRPPKEDPSDLELPPIDPTSTPSELNLLEGLDLPSPNLGPVCPGCHLAQPTGARICVQCGIDLATGKSVLEGQKVQTLDLGYAAGRAQRGTRGRGRHEVIGVPTRGYWSDAALSFVYPFKNVNNAVTFAIILVVALAEVFLRMPGLFTLLGRLIIFGWLAALYLSVVQNTAMAVEDLPGIRMEDGPWDDFIKPAFKYVGAFACALFPAAVYAILAGTGVLPESLQSGLAFLLWLGAGILVWPIFVMLFAFDTLNMLWRADLIITTIFRTFLPYLALWLMLLVVGFSSVVPLLGPILHELGITVPLPSVESWGLAGALVVRALDVYVMIVVMRQIGLYYLHFKKRFTLVFE